MSDRYFFDTNILVYLYSEDEETKKLICQKKVNTCDQPTISTQVVNELINVLSKKYKLNWDTIKEVLKEIKKSFIIEIVNIFDIQLACEIAKRYKYSYFDSLMIGSALNCESSIIYTEDLQHGQIIEQELKIINPFIGTT